MREQLAHITHYFDLWHLKKAHYSYYFEVTSALLASTKTLKNPQGMQGHTNQSDVKWQFFILLTNCFVLKLPNG